MDDPESSLLTEEHWMKSVFRLCDHENTGMIILEEFMSYLKSVDQSESQDAEMYDQLEEMFKKATSAKDKIPYDIYKIVVDQWLECMKSTSPQEALPQLNSSAIGLGDQSSLLQFSFGTIEGFGGDISVLDNDELNTKVESLNHQIEKCNAEKESLRKDLSQAEETVFKYMKEINVKTEKNKTLGSELRKSEEIREDLVLSSDKLKRMYDDLYEKKLKLTQDMSKLQETVKKLNEEKTKCLDLISKYKYETKSLRQKNHTLSSQIEDLTNNMIAVDDVMKSLNQLDVKVEQMEDKISVLRKDFTALTTFLQAQYGEIKKIVYERKLSGDLGMELNVNRQMANDRLVSSTPLSAEISAMYGDSSMTFLPYPLCMSPVFYSEDFNNNEVNDDEPVSTEEMQSKDKQETTAIYKEQEVAKSNQINMLLSVVCIFWSIRFVFLHFINFLSNILFSFLKVFCLCISLITMAIILQAIGLGALVDNFVLALTNLVKVEYIDRPV